MAAGRSQRARPRATPHASPVNLSGTWNATDADVAAQLHAQYARSLERLPDGDTIFRGLAFRLGARADGPRWLVLGDDDPVDVDLGEATGATHLVVAHFCDSWRDASGVRPDGRPVGWVEPPGERLARYELVGSTGRRHALDVRRRFEIADGIVGWGYLPFAAVSHRFDEPVDWRGPHERHARYRYAAAGHAGPLTILPGSWGPAQTGVSDFVPTVDDDITIWLHAIALDPTDPPARLRLSSATGGRVGTAVVVAGLTLFAGRSHPLRLEPRRQLMVRGPRAALPETDLGVAIRAVPAAAQPPTDRASGRVVGWGREPTIDIGPPVDEPDGWIVDVATTPDAVLHVGGWSVPVADLPVAEPAVERSAPDGAVSVRPLRPPDVPVRVRVTADLEPSPSRVRFVDADGRYLPPVAHRTEVNPGLYEDSGADLLLGSDVYAYVPGEFEVRLPLGTVTVEAVKGFEHRPIRTRLEVDGTTDRIDLAFERPIDLRPAGWVTSDSHVHFLAPSTALLQAAAEDVTFVHLLSTQWGDHFTNVTDLPWGSCSDPARRHQVIVGTENRQNVLGHLALLGARQPVLPQASGGSPEGHLGGATDDLLGEWAERCRAAGGLVAAAHFPLPYAEVAAAILDGTVDAVEMQTFAPGLDTPSIVEWYQFLSAGYRLPVLGGTDKMTATVPVGAVRTYARLGPDAEPTFEAWAAAVRAGRTFATSGPVIELAVEGRGPGDTIALPIGGGRLEVRARVRAAQPVVAALELVVDGRVAEAVTDPGATDLALATTIEVDRGAWIAARSRSDHEIASAFATSMASHTSPVYVEVGGRGPFSADAANGIVPIVEGTAHWLETLAAVGDASRRSQMAGRIAASADRLRTRIDRANEEPSGGGSLR